MTFAVPGPDRRRTDHGPYPFSDSHNFANWCSTIVAIQQELGLLAQRRYRHDSFDCADSFTARQNIKREDLSHSIVPGDPVALDLRVASNSQHSVFSVFGDAGIFTQIKRNNYAITGVGHGPRLQLVSVSILIN